MLKENKEVLIKALALLLNNSLEQMEVPKQWKLANITPIYKKGDKRVPGNYRPISLTSIVCKIKESLVRDHVHKYMDDNHIYSDKQFGFISGRSTVLQLLHVLDDWSRILDQGGCVDVIYFDYMKAFDKVSHQKLLHKLKWYGVPNPILGWIKSFLLNCKQRVVINGVMSKQNDVYSGVPQGSVMGPPVVCNVYQ